MRPDANVLLPSRKASLKSKPVSPISSKLLLFLDYWNSLISNLKFWFLVLNARTRIHNGFDFRALHQGKINIDKNLRRLLSELIAKWVSC